MNHPYATLCKIFGYKLASLRMNTVLRDPFRSRILMFHAITDGPSTEEYACPVDRLANIVDAYRVAGFRFVSLADLLRLSPAEGEYGFCAITFDDGLSSVETLAAPLLSEMGVPFTVYMISDMVGKEGYLTADELKTLSKNPLCTIGSHSVSHPMFRFLKRSQALYELTESKRALETIIQQPVHHFAFPYGSAYACSHRDVLLAKRAGYASAVLSTATVLNRKQLMRPYSLPRLDRDAYLPAENH